MLIKLGACMDQLEKFKKLFGKKIKLTEKIVLQHYKEFNMEWAVFKLLSTSAWEEYDKIRASAWEEYEKIKVLTFYKLYDRNKI